jgi:hypothetical protein
VDLAAELRQVSLTQCRLGYLILRGATFSASQLDELAPVLTEHLGIEVALLSG